MSGFRVQAPGGYPGFREGVRRQASGVRLSPDYSSARSRLRKKSGGGNELRPEFSRILLPTLRRWCESRRIIRVRAHKGADDLRAGTPSVQFAICNLQFAICNVGFARTRKSQIANYKLVAIFAQLVVFAALCLLPSGAAVANENPAITGVRVGFDGHFRVGFWTPVEVALHGGSEQLAAQIVLSLVDGDGMRCETIGRKIEVPAGGDARVTAYAKFGSVRGDLTIALRDGEKTAAERTFIVDQGDDQVNYRPGFASTQGLILSLGNPIGLDEAVGRARDPAEKVNLVALADAAQLPDDWLGYEAVDQLVIGPAPAGLNETLAEGSPQLAALDRWLAEGGRLVLALGADSEHFLSSDRPLSRFLPGKFEGTAHLTRTTSLEMFGGTYGGAPLRWRRGDRRAIAATRLSDVQGHLVLSEGDFPLLVRRAYTFGEVTFAAVDFSQSPLVDWAGRNLALKRVLGQRTGSEKEDLDTAPAPAAHLGLVDLSGQLRSALDQFRGVRLAPFWSVAVLAAVYIALVGPIDYLLLKGVIRRMEWTWITFPLVVLVFCGGAAWAAHRLKGDRLLSNQVDLVDIDLPSERVRGTTWFTLFSPTTTTYNLSLEPQVPHQERASDDEIAISWQGLPGNVLGGMEQQVSAPSGVARSYQISPDRRTLHRAPIPVWSTKSFVGRWRTKAPSTIEVHLKPGRDEVVEGTLVNRLGVPLKDCMLVSGRWAWQFDELPVDRPTRVRAGEQRDLFALLKDFKYIRERDKDTLVQVATPYDQSTFNIHSILQQMMFYDGANGRSYTGLLNRYQPYVDLSGHLQLGQVILWGTADQPASAVLRDGQPLADDDHTTIYRFLISVR
jgi:hypothetical protein